MHNPTKTVNQCIKKGYIKTDVINEFQATCFKKKCKTSKNLLGPASEVR